MTRHHCHPQQHPHNKHTFSTDIHWFELSTYTEIVNLRDAQPQSERDLLEARWVRAKTTSHRHATRCPTVPPVFTCTSTTKNERRHGGREAPRNHKQTFYHHTWCGVNPHRRTRISRTFRHPALACPLGPHISPRTQSATITSPQIMNGIPWKEKKCRVTSSATYFKLTYSGHIHRTQNAVKDGCPECPTYPRAKEARHLLPAPSAYPASISTVKPTKTDRHSSPRSLHCSSHRRHCRRKLPATRAHSTPAPREKTPSSQPCACPLAQTRLPILVLVVDAGVAVGCRRPPRELATLDAHEGGSAREGYRSGSFCRSSRSSRPSRRTKTPREPQRGSALACSARRFRGAAGVGEDLRLQQGQCARYPCRCYHRRFRLVGVGVGVSAVLRCPSPLSPPPQPPPPPLPLPLPPPSPPPVPAAFLVSSGGVL